jgi:putative ATP-grasp target RiPP
MTSTSTASEEQYLEVSARFPQCVGALAVSTSTEAASTHGARPFALRFGQPRLPAAGVAEFPAWRYCDERQIAVGADGQPYMAKGEMTTTGPSPDGQGSTGNEEWTPDFAGDMSA